MASAEAPPIEKQREIMRAWQGCPLVRHYSFSDKKLWGKQEEILQAIRKHKRVVVKSGNTVGKSFIAADVVMDWLITKQPSKVITTAPTFQQVETILWREIRQACFTSKIPLGVQPLQTELRFSDEWFALGVSTDKPVNFQGKHSPNLLVVLDEASGISTEIWDMVEALHPSAILAIGNPLEPNGRFFECFQSALWHKITISCLDAVKWQDANGKIPGLVTRDWVKEMADIHGQSSPWYRIHVEGEFPEQDEYAIIERQWVDRARQGLDADGIVLDAEDEYDETRIIGIDLASKHGENLTVIGYRYGHTITQLTGYMRATTSFTRDQAKTLYSQKSANTLVADADGIGESFADIMSDVHVPCVDFHGGTGVKAIQTQKFKNLRSQFYWIVARKFEKGLYNLKHLPQKDFEMLREQLCSVRAVSKDPLGRFQIESKEDMMSRGIKSPDFADTFMMMEYAAHMHRHADLRPMSYGSL